MWYKLVGRNFEHLGDVSQMLSVDNKHNLEKFTDPTFRRVALDHFTPEIYVSSVFLAIDHNFGQEGGPILFESMVFGLEEEQCLRARTWIDIYYMHIMHTEFVIHTLSKSQDAYKPYSLSHFVFNNEIVSANMNSTIKMDRLIVDDGVNQPPISFGLFNNFFYKRVLRSPDTREYDVKWWELGDPKCDIMGEVGPYLDHLVKPG